MGRKKVEVWRKETYGGKDKEIKLSGLEREQLLAKKLAEQGLKVKAYLVDSGSICYLVLEFDDGFKAYFSDGEYGNVPLWRFSKK